MRVEIIIVTYNSSKVIIGCIESIKKHIIGYSYTVTVVDNKSSDNTVQIIESLFPEVTIYEMEGNSGYGKANNYAILKSTADYIQILNPDTILLNNIFKYYETHITLDKNIGILGAELFSNKLSFSESHGNIPSMASVIHEQLLKNIFSHYRLKKIK